MQEMQLPTSITSDHHHQSQDQVEEDTEMSTSESQKTKIRKCQVALERLRQDKVDIADNRQEADLVQNDTQPSLAQSSPFQVIPHEFPNIEEKSASPMNVVAEDKTIKENKCSSKISENVISKKRGDRDNYSPENKVVSENKLNIENNKAPKDTKTNSALSKQKIIEKSTLGEEKIKSKKRRRKTNKTGFPCKIKKKKKIVRTECEDSSSGGKLEDEASGNLLQPLPLTSSSKDRGGIFDNLETFKISAANINLDPSRQTSAGRPIRESRFKENDNNETLPENSSSKGKKRMLTPEPGREKKTKRTRQARYEKEFLGQPSHVNGVHN